jgi:hypothetical protein
MTIITKTAHVSNTHLYLDALPGSEHAPTVALSEESLVDGPLRVPNCCLPAYFDNGKWWTIPKRESRKMAAIETIRRSPWF